MGPKLCTVETFFAFFFCKAYLWPVMASAASSNFILCSHLEVYKKGRISQTEIGLLHIVTLFAWPWFPRRKLWKGSWGGFDGGWVRGDGHGVICRTDRATPEGLGGTG